MYHGAWVTVRNGDRSKSQCNPDRGTVKVVPDSGIVELKRKSKI
jgi:hypothetical protein